MKKSEVKQVCFFIFFGVVLYWGLEHYALIGSILFSLFRLILPFLIGIGIAFILNVPMTMIEKLLKKRMKNQKEKRIRILSVVTALLLFLFVIAFILFLVIPELIHTMNGLMDQTPTFLEELKNWIASTFPEQSLEQINFDSLRDQLIELSQNGISVLFTSSLKFIMTLIRGIVNVGMGTVFAVYLLLEKEKLVRQWKAVLYACLNEKYVDRLCEIGKSANQTFTNFITGQCMESCILGSIFLVGMLFFRFPYALTISVFIAVTSLIPVFGATIAMVIGAFLIFLVSPVQAFWFILFFLVIQQLEGNFIYPKVVGKSIGLPPIWVMLAVILGGSVGGILGMLVSVPVSAIVYSLLGSFVKGRLTKKKLRIEEK